MTWLVILEILIRLFGPVLVEWLERLLDDAARGMPAGPHRDPDGFRDDLADLFDAARRRTWVWQLRKRAAVRVAERMALERSEELRRSAISGGFVPPLTVGERVELRAALA